MLGFFRGKGKRKENKNENIIYTPCKGTVVPITEVPDPVFSEKVLGDGFAVIPAEGKIYAPTDGEVSVGVFENIITTLSEEDFTPDDIKYCYNLRWGIETSFRDLKHTIGATNLHSKKTEYVAFELWSKLILYNFCSIIILHVPVKSRNRKYEYQVNFSIAMKIFFE